MAKTEGLEIIQNGCPHNLKEEGCRVEGSLCQRMQYESCPSYQLEQQHKHNAAYNPVLHPAELRNRPVVGLKL